MLFTIQDSQAGQDEEIEEAVALMKQGDDENMEEFDLRVQHKKEMLRA